MGIKVCANQGAGLFWGPERGYNRGNFGCLKTIPFIFGMKQPWDKENQVYK